MKKVFGLLLLFAASFSHANPDWFERGNGGFAVVCPGSEPQTLDLFEAYSPEYHRNWTLDEESIHDTATRVNYLLTKIEKLNPSRAKLYREWYKTFNEEAEFLKDAKFENFNDTGKVSIPDSCELKQVFYQRDPSVLNKFRYTANANVWNSLTPKHQAALILHELIYREFAHQPFPHMTSEPSRYLNGWINSLETKTVSQQDYILKLQSLYVTRADYKGYPVLLSYQSVSQGTWEAIPVKFDANNGDTLALEATEPLTQGSVTLTPYCLSPEKVGSLGFATILPDGKIDSLSTNLAIITIQMCLATYQPTSDFKIHGAYWKFSGNYLGSAGRSAVRMDPFGGWLFSYGDYEVTTLHPEASTNINIYFDSQGRPERFTFLGNACLTKAAGTMTGGPTKKIRVGMTYFDASLELSQWPLKELDARAQALPACSTN